MAGRRAGLAAPLSAHEPARDAVEPGLVNKRRACPENCALRLQVRERRQTAARPRLADAADAVGVALARKDNVVAAVAELRARFAAAERVDEGARVAVIPPLPDVAVAVIRKSADAPVPLPGIRTRGFSLTAPGLTRCWSGRER